MGISGYLQKAGGFIAQFAGMINLADLCVILLLVCLAWASMKKGLVHSLLDVVYSISSLFLGIFIAPFVSKFIMQTNWFSETKTTFSEYLVSKQGANIQNAAESVAASVNSTGLPAQIKESVISGISQGALGTGSESIASGVAHSILVILITMFVISMIFSVFRFFMRFFSRFLKQIVKLPIVNQINKILGLVFGFIQGCLVVYVLMALLTLLNTFPDFEKFIFAINNSAVASRFYNNNIIFMAIERYLNLGLW